MDADLRALEDALNESRDDTAHLLASLDDFVFCIRFQPPDHNGHVLYASPNSKAHALFGSRFEFGPDWGDVMRNMIHPDDRDIYEGMSREALTGTAVGGEYRVIGTDGVVRWIWTRVRVRIEGGFYYLDGVSSDVSERHKFMQERAEAEQFRLELVALLSDKIGNAVTGYIGFIELALQDNALTDDTRHFLENVAQSASVIDEIRRDALSSS